MDDLKELSVTDLKKLHIRVCREIERRTTQSKRRLLKEFQKLAADEGLDTSDILLASTSATPRAATKTRTGTPKPRLPPIYFNPVDARQGWSGRGRQPEWVKTYIENGGHLEDLKAKQ